MVRLAAGDTEGVRALCLEPHDLAISKYAAGRHKDAVFTRELARRGLVTRSTLLSLLGKTAVDDARREQIRARIDADLSSGRK